jgi:hypothetical protein
MKEPSVTFLVELATALREAEHPKVAHSIAAGFLWSLYPEWYDQYLGKRTVEDVINYEYSRKFMAPKAGQP